MTHDANHFILTFLRHAESVGNAEGYFQGQGDFPLTDKGRMQAQALARRWQAEGRTFDFVFASPLSRARETAEIVTAALGLSVEFDPIWMERHNGELTGKKWEEGQSLFPHFRFRNPYQIFAGHGEGDWELYLRAGQALQSLLTRAPGRYLIVSHGALLNQLMKAIVGVAPHANYQGAQFRFKNTAFASATDLPESHRWYINGLNDCAHWRDDE